MSNESDFDDLQVMNGLRSLSQKTGAFVLVVDHLQEYRSWYQGFQQQGRRQRPGAGDAG